MLLWRLQPKLIPRPAAWDPGVLGCEGKAYRMSPPESYSPDGKRTTWQRAHLKEEKNRIQDQPITTQQPLEGQDCLKRVWYISVSICHIPSSPTPPLCPPPPPAPTPQRPPLRRLILQTSCSLSPPLHTCVSEAKGKPFDHTKNDQQTKQESKHV